MPFPLVLLDHHLLPTQMNFLLKNLSSLKALGYKKVLLEINQELSPAAMKAQIQRIQQLQPMDISNTFSNLLKLLNLLEAEKIDYEFIDPQTQTEAHALSQRLQKAFSSGSEKMISQLMQEQQNVTNARDEIMSKKVIEAAKMLDGGVIFLTGYMHKRGINLFEKYQTNYFRYLVLTSSRLESNLPLFNPDNRVWLQLKNDVERARFYQTDAVRFFNMDENPSFELIESVCQLSQTYHCEEAPLLGQYFSKATKQPFSFHLDEHAVLHATTHIPNEELANFSRKLNQQFPKLRFFKEKQDAHTQISVMGLNLPENQDMLTQEFRRLELMK